MGADYVFDTTFSADLTIMEEANEFVQRFVAGEFKERPMFTSCCPGWLRFIKSQYPHLVKQLSTAKSPQQMFGAVMKTYFADKLGVAPEKIYTLSIMPCVAKKGEREMEMFYEEYAGHDIDAVLTTRELAKMIRSAHISPETLEDIESDRPMQEGTGAGVIFGATGGVMEAALRTAYYILKKENPPADAFKMVRSPGFQENHGVMEAELAIDDITVRIAVVSGLGNTRRLLDMIERGEVHYDFVEVMACPGGCVGGGGQPIHDGEEWAFDRGQKSCTAWMKMQIFGSLMRIRISISYMRNILESPILIKRICFCIPIIWKLWQRPVLDINNSEKSEQERRAFPMTGERPFRIIYFLFYACVFPDVNAEAFVFFCLPLEAECPCSSERLPDILSRQFHRCSPDPVREVWSSIRGRWDGSVKLRYKEALRSCPQQQTASSDSPWFSEDLSGGNSCHTGSGHSIF